MIRAGRSQGGQPIGPGPAEPDLDRSGGPAQSRETSDVAPASGAGMVPEPEPRTARAAEASLAGGTAEGPAAAHRSGTSAATLQEQDGPGTGADDPEQAAAGAARAAGGGGRAAFRRALGRTWVRHLILIAVYQGAGVAATWPRFTYLADGKLPATSDVSGFVWNIWWSGHQLLHLNNPFFTKYMAAPIGTHLAFSTLMPLAGWITAPITVLYGPSASFTLLTIVTPGLLCYAMYRAAKMWLNEPGAIIAGAFFGLSSMLLWQNWYHVNIAIGTIFLPVAVVVAGPELIGMMQQILSGGASPPAGEFASNYAQFGVSLPTLFAPSPRLGTFGLGQLSSAYSYNNSEQLLEGLPTFGAVLTG